MLKNLNNLMDYLEDHMTDEISLTSTAKQVGISEYHLKRTFSFIAGISLSEYIKKRRLALANHDLINQKSVTEVAFKYQYQSLEGFSRAFKEFTGYLPSEIIKNQQQIAFPKLTFYINVKGGTTMEFKIEDKGAFNLVGVTKQVPIQFEGVNAEIEALAKTITAEQRKHMHQLGDIYPNQVLNASYNYDETWQNEQGTLTHMIGFATSQENTFSDLEQVQIPKQTWAIFPNRGSFPAVLQDTWGKIYSEWLPSSDYELVDEPNISFTRYGDQPDDTYSEIWIAVKKK